MGALKLQGHTEWNLESWKRLAGVKVTAWPRCCVGLEFTCSQENKRRVIRWALGESSHTASLSWGWGVYSLWLLAQTQLVTSFGLVPRNVTAASTVKDWDLVLAIPAAPYLFLTLEYSNTANCCSSGVSLTFFFLVCFGFCLFAISKVYIWGLSEHLGCKGRQTLHSSALLFADAVFN